MCPEGFFCDGLLASLLVSIPGHGVISPMVCPSGSYCPIGTQYSRQYLCPVGTFSNLTGLSDEKQCIPCTLGNVCSSKGLTEPDSKCSAGYFCSRGAYVPKPLDGETGGICPRGYYCNTGSSVGIPTLDPVLQ